MDEEAKKAAAAAAEGEKGKDNPKEAETDAFGNDNKAPVAPKKEEDKGKGGEGSGKYAPIPEDHPTISALKQQIEEVKREYGGNLSGQRDVIKRLESEIETLRKSGGKGEKGKEGKDEDNKDLLFKDIKWSKDLTNEEREEMTETEIKQMDEIASMKEAQNVLYAESKKKEKTDETKKVEDLNNTVRSTALEMAKAASGKDNTELANQIIEAVKMFNLTGLSEAQVKERVQMAAQHVPTYKAPKEQTNKGGKVVKTEGAGGDDPFGVDKIIEEATSGGNGNYAL